MTRVDGVQHTLYLLFNEGYKASQGDSLLRTDLCTEALRLRRNCSPAHPAGDRPTTHALLALMYFNLRACPPASMPPADCCCSPSRTESGGASGRLRRALFHSLRVGGGRGGQPVSPRGRHRGLSLAWPRAATRPRTGGRSSRFTTSWMEVDGSPVVALNRAVAVARVRGAKAGLHALDSMPRSAGLKNHHQRHAVAGQLWFEAGDRANAAASFRRAAELATVAAERTLLAAPPRGSRRVGRIILNPPRSTIFPEARRDSAATRCAAHRHRSRGRRR